MKRRSLRQRSRRAQNIPSSLLAKIDEFIKPILGKAEERKYTTKERDACLHLIYHSLNYLLCIVSPYIDVSKRDIGPSIIKHIIENIDMIKDEDIKQEVYYIAINIKQSAEDVLIASIRLVRNILGRMLTVNPTRIDDELIAEAIWATYTAIYRYDPSKVAISTYIAWWIKSMVGKKLDEKRLSTNAPEPPWLNRLHFIFNKKVIDWLVKLGREPSLDEFASATDYELLEFMSRKTSLVSLYDKTEVETDIESTVQDESIDIEGDVSFNKLLEKVNVVLNEFTTHERELLAGLLGLDGRKDEKIRKSEGQKLLKRFRERFIEMFGHPEEFLPEES